MSGLQSLLQEAQDRQSRERVWDAPEYATMREAVTEVGRTIAGLDERDQRKLFAELGRVDEKGRDAVLAGREPDTAMSSLLRLRERILREYGQ